MYILCSLLHNFAMFCFRPKNKQFTTDRPPLIIFFMLFFSWVVGILASLEEILLTNSQKDEKHMGSESKLRNFFCIYFFTA